MISNGFAEFRDLSSTQQVFQAVIFFS